MNRSKKASHRCVYASTAHKERRTTTETIRVVGVVVSQSMCKNNHSAYTGCSTQTGFAVHAVRISLRAAKRAHIIRSRFALSLSLPASKSESRWPISVLQLHVLWPALCLCFGFFRSLSPLSFSLYCLCILSTHVLFINCTQVFCL